MIEVDLPDGSVAEFPDGTSPEVMKQAIGKKFPVQPQQPAAPGYGEDMLNAAPSGLRSGVEGLLGSIGSANKATGAGMGWLAGKLGAGPKMQEFVRNVGRRANLMPFAPSSDEIGGATDAAVKAVPGSEQFQDVTRYQPKTLPGKIVRTGAEILPSMLAGPGGVVRKGVQTVTSSVGGELAGAATEGTKWEPWARAAGMVLGGAAVAKNPAGAKVPRTKTDEVMANLNAEKDALYKASEEAGVIIKPEGMKHLIKKIVDDVGEFGYDKDAHPGARIVLRKIAENQGQNVTLKGLDGIRKVAGNVGYIPLNKPNNEVVNRIVGHIDDLYRSQNPEHMAGIDTVVGVQSLDKARRAAHKAFKLEKSLNLIKKGNILADRNITDTRVKSVKSQLGKINDPFAGWGRGYTEAEKAAAGKAAKYTNTERALHGASVLNPIGGGKLTAGSHIAAAAFNAGTGNIPALALQAMGAGAGFGFQKMGEMLAKKNVDEFVDLVANGGVPAPAVKHSLLLLSKEKREAVIRALAAANASQNARPPLEITVGRPAEQ